MVYFRFSGKRFPVKLCGNEHLLVSSFHNPTSQRTSLASSLCEPESQVPVSMQECIDIAGHILPELVEEVSAPRKSQQDNLSIMLGIANKMQTSRLQSPGLVSECLIDKMGSLKGYTPHPKATGAEPPLRAVSGLIDPTTKGGKGLVSLTPCVPFSRNGLRPSFW